MRLCGGIVQSFREYCVLVASQCSKLADAGDIHRGSQEQNAR